MKQNRRTIALGISLAVIASITIGLWADSATASNSLMNRLRQTIIVNFVDTSPGMIQDVYEPANAETFPQAVVPKPETPPLWPEDELPVLSLTSGRTVTSGDVSIQLQRVDFHHAFARSIACIQLPDNGDWLPDASITIDGKLFVARGWSLLDAKNPNTYASRRRCYNFDFAVPSDAGTTAGQISFSVERLITSIPELITLEHCESARQKLQAAQSGIELVCKSESNGSASFEVLQKPDSLAYADTQKIIVESLSTVVEGPWTINLMDR